MPKMRKRLCIPIEKVQAGPATHGLEGSIVFRRKESEPWTDVAKIASWVPIEERETVAIALACGARAAPLLRKLIECDVAGTRDLQPEHRVKLLEQWIAEFKMEARAVLDPRR